jgi:hypothetical protein
MQGTELNVVCESLFSNISARPRKQTRHCRLLTSMHPGAGVSEIEGNGSHSISRNEFVILFNARGTNWKPFGRSGDQSGHLTSSVRRYIEPV